MKLGVQYKKQNFLQVSFTQHRGLRLTWNFKDIRHSQNYFKHIFVLVSHKQEQKILILDSLYKKMKNGDLFCCIYAHKKYSYKMGRWVQKNLLNNFRTQQYLRKISGNVLTKQIKIKMIEKASKQVKELDEPVIVNFLGVQNSQIDFYRYEIIRHRNALNPSFQYIVNIFGNLDINNISVHNGINFYQTNVSTFQDNAEFYHKLINSAAIESAKIDIISLDGEITLFNQKKWKNSDFNRITAKYYGPTSLYDYDNLYFYCLQPPKDIQYEFQIKLQIKLFQKKILQNVKRIKINFRRDNYYCFPIYQNSTFFQHFHEKNILLSQNPYRADIMVKFRSKRIQIQQIQ